MEPTKCEKQLDALAKKRTNLEAWYIKQTIKLDRALGEEQQHLKAIKTQAGHLMESYPRLSLDAAMQEAEKEMIPLWNQTQKTANRIAKAVERSKAAAEAVAAKAIKSEGGQNIIHKTADRLTGWAGKVLAKKDKEEKASATPPSQA